MRRLTWMALVALLLLWIATVEQEPGGFEALSAQMESVEQSIGHTLRQSERPLVVRRDGADVTEYSNGVLCETNGDQATDCQPLIYPAYGY